MQPGSVNNLTKPELQNLAAANGFHMSDMDARLDSPCQAITLQDDLQSLTDGVIGKLQDWADT